MIKKWGPLAALSLLFVAYGLFFAPAGFLTTDEFIYTAMTDRLVTSGTFFIANGYQETPSATLRLLFLTPTAQGLTPQYPAGYALISAPFFLLGGARGMMLLNTFAAIGLLMVTYRLAKLLFDDEDLALNAMLILALATFIADYAFAILPHALAGLFMVTAAYYTALAVRRVEGANIYLLFAGLALGLGINIRVDVVLFAPLLAAWLIGSARAPAIKVAMLALGMIPGLAGASWLNYLRFGSFSPITYGLDGPRGSGGLTALAAYQELLPLLIIGVLAVIAFGFAKVRDLFLGWRGFLIAALAIAIVVLAPPTAGLAARVFKGLYVLLVDLQSYDYVERYSGLSTLVDGKWILFSGNVKKALFESLPFAGFLALPLAKIFGARDRASYVLCALLPFGWFAFFGINQWHGGQSTNMRYFSTQLPYLAILAAAAWREIRVGGEIDDTARPAHKASIPGIVPGIVLGIGMVGLILVWTNLELVAQLYLIGLGRWLFYLALMVAVMVLVSPSTRLILPIARGVFYVTLAFGFYGVIGHDLKISYFKRSWYLENKSDCKNIAHGALVITHLPSLYYCHLGRPGARLAMFRPDDKFIDYPMIDRVLSRGNEVFISLNVRNAMAAQPRATRYLVRQAPNVLGQAPNVKTDLYRVVLPTPGKP
ncbi:MAG: glycosyltransferase family 39 protein [Alphaproteobacteria bacterium]|nr:glycosyltransferase family 39 protein [Alphaproteobacteria bacterium]